jgi:uncharacterized membrane protein YjfL (UPF0719 family)
MIKTYTHTALEWIQTAVPYGIGDHAIASLSSGMRVLIALAIVGLCVVIRGRFNYHVFAGKAERAMLTDSNPAFKHNQHLIAVAFLLPVGAALMSTGNIPAFIEKVITALVIQIVAMAVIHAIWRREHRAMLNKDVAAGKFLGWATIFVGAMTMFEILR